MRALAVFVALALAVAILAATGGTPMISSKVRMKADGMYIGGITKVSGIADSSSVMTATVQGKVIKSAGPSSFGNSAGLVVVKQLNSTPLPPYAISSNYGALESWYSASQAASGGLEKNFVIEILNENSLPSAVYKIFHAVPVRFTKEAGSDGNTYNVYKFTTTRIERDYEVN